MTVKKIAGYLHLWLGLASGLVVVVIGLTGSIYAFQEELKEVFYKDKLFVTPQATPVRPLSELLTAAKEALGGKKKITRVEVENKPDRAYVFRAQKTNARKVFYWNYYEYYNQVYINPYTAEVLAVENTKTEFFQIVLTLHRQLLMGDTVGHVVSCSAVSMFVILLITGLVLWWPKKWSKSNIKSHVKVKWEAKFKRVNYDVHRVFGFYAFATLLVISLTGLVWSFEWFDHTVQFIANGGHAVKKEKALVSDTTHLKEPAAMDSAWALARRGVPAASYRITLPQKHAATLNVSAYLAESNRYDRVQQFYDQYTGSLLQSKSFDEATGGEQLRLMNYDIHTGSVLGFGGKCLAFLSGLVAAILPVTGFVIWWKRLKKEKKAKKEKHAHSKKAVKVEPMPALS